MTKTPSIGTSVCVLATDLDGTFIPLLGNHGNQADLAILHREIEKSGITLVFVTGRHFASVTEAIQEFKLPSPDWIICDVGTSIFERTDAGEFRPIEAYNDHLQQIIAAMPISSLLDRLKTIQGLRLQEEDKLGRFKLSFYAEAEELERLVDQIQQELDKTNAPYSIIHSVDPFNGDGLIDLLPAKASKAHALKWWSLQRELAPDAIVFAGDSGNDLAALTAGYRAIVVANAAQGVARRASDEHQKAGWKNRLFLARQSATSGVLEGCRWFELIGQDQPNTLRLGATPLTEKQAHFRVWAPHRQNVSVEILESGSTSRRFPLHRDQEGYFSGVAPDVSPDTHYYYLLDGELSRPDPTSLYQPAGVHGPSMVIHHEGFAWTDRHWAGVPKRDLIIYELHVGAFTEEGTFRAALKRLPELLDLGVTAVEIMPVAQSPGRWNWGYDGVGLFSVRDTYGKPNDFKAFVDACHDNDLGVLLDVVYNHIGPEGNYLADYGPYFTENHQTPWGEAFNYDGPDSQHVRQFIIENAIRWLDEYHLDGLRLDAVHCMYDDQTPDILNEIRGVVSNYARSVTRVIHLIAETNIYNPKLLDSNEQQEAYDAIWSDCIMYSLYAHGLPDLKLSHRAYRGEDDLGEALQHGYIYYYDDGKTVRVSSEQRRRLFAIAAEIPIPSFVTALQTHDAVGHHPHGIRLHHLTSKGFQKAAAALTLLYPSIPLIFMGEEYASDSLFAFFADFHDPGLRDAVDAGRAREFPPDLWNGAVPPSDPRAFLNAKCAAPDDRDDNMLTWYRELITLRKRGTAEGWLSASRMNVEHNSRFGLFALHFDGENGTQIKIQARLQSAESQSADLPCDVSAGRILLSSNPVTRDGTGRILLGLNQALITSQESA